MLQLDYNSSYRKGKLLTDEDTLLLIRKQFSQYVEDIDFIRKKADNFKIPDHEYAIQLTGMFDFGMYQEIESFLNASEIPFIRTEAFTKQLNCGFAVETLFDGLVYENRYYGLETVENALECGRGTIVIGTGGGKSFIQASLLENIHRNVEKPFKCIIVVPGLSLVNQLCDNFQEYGVNFTYSGWTGTIPLQDTEVVICNSENFCSQFGNHKWLREVDVVIADEVHKCKSQNEITKNIAKIKTPNRFGFTGTLPKNKIDEWKIIGTFGPVIYEKNSKELRDEGFLANAKIKIVKLNHKYPPGGNYQNQLNYIYTSTTRNTVLKNIAQKLNKSVMIMVNHLTHGEDLEELCKSDDKVVYFVCGATPVEERMRIIQEMENNDNIICIAMSSIFSTGINIKNLHYIMFVSGGKSFIRIVQSIGRGLRLHDSKTHLTMIDVYDNIRHSELHVEERKKFYDEEQIEWEEVEINLLGH